MAAPQIDPQQSFPDLEQRVLDRWRERDVFARSLSQREGARPWVFWEGPPTANGRPGVHHVLSRVFKDIFPRFRTMRGYKVERRGGWDCHGLPVEIAVEKKLGLHNKHEIEALKPTVRESIEFFNAECRGSVFEFLEDWDKLTERIGYWVDLEHAYRTMDSGYVESVWSSLKTMNERGLLYQGNRVAPFCTRCGTALSSHEVALGYKDITDTSAYVRLPVLETPRIMSSPVEPGDSLLVWTTTPWTLHANMAAAVHPTTEYVRVRAADRDGNTHVVIVATALVHAALGDETEILGAPFPGSALVGIDYTVPFKRAGESSPRIGSVIAADYVTTDSGTGVVHLAPAFGQDDYDALGAAKLDGTYAGDFDPRVAGSMINPVLTDGTYDANVTAAYPELADTFVKDLDPTIVNTLSAAGLLWRKQRYEHSYPHCWRCDTPLVYYARPSWYIATASLRDNMLAANDTVAWHPPHIKDGRFGEWLRGNVDWAISRERYWGTPLPIWRSTDHPSSELPRTIVIGSLAELEALSGTKLDDPHRPYVDDVEFDAPDPDPTAGPGAESGSYGARPTLHFKRVPEVLDVWFDSGAMPFAQDGAVPDTAFGTPQTPEGQAHYEANRTADYICEALDQTRGWFYSLLAISTLLRDEAPYRNVACVGLILDEDGQKMSKSKGNIVEPFEVIDRFGADALRWYFFTSKQPWDGYRFSQESVRDGVRLFLLPLWNTASFYAQYATIAEAEAATGKTHTRQRTELDDWIASRVEATTELVTERLDAYDVTTAGRAIGELVEDLSNWYVRRSRRRFWEGDPVALETLRSALVRIATLLAPFTPFVADELYEQLGGGAESVHLADWPAADPSARDLGLESDMATARETVRLGLAARAASGINLRQPLRAAVVVASGEERSAIERLTEVIVDELNVKKLRFVAEADELGRVLLKPNLKALGPRFGKHMGIVRSAIDGLNGTHVAASLRAGEPVVIDVDGQPHQLGEGDLLLSLEAPDGYQLEREGSHAVALELEIDEPLRREGLARAIVRQIQVARQDAGLDLTDRINLKLGGDAALEAAALEHEDWISRETLATSFAVEHGIGNELSVDGLLLTLSVTRA